MLGRTLTRYLGAAALIAFAKSSVTEFAKVERALNSLQLQMANLGVGGGQALSRVRGELEALDAAGDGALRETIPAFQTFLGLTKSVEASMALVRLSANIAESGLMDLAGAASTLEAVVSGRATRSLAQLGINLKEDADGAIDAKEALALLFSRFPDQIRNIEDMQDRLDRLASVWSKVKRVTGEVLAQSWDAAARNLTVFQVAARDTAGWFTGIGESIKGFFVDLQRPFPIDTDALKKQQEATDATAKKAEDDKAAADEREKQRLAEQEAIRIAGLAADAERRKEQAKRAKKAAELEAQVEAALWQEKVRIARDGSEQRLEAELAYLDQKREQVLIDARATGADVTKIEQTFLAMRTLKQTEHRVSQLKADGDWLDEMRENWTEYGDDIEDYFEEQLELNRTNQEALRQAQLVTVEDALEVEANAKLRSLETLEAYGEEWLDIELTRLEEARAAEIEEAETKGADIHRINEKYLLLARNAEAKHTKAMIALTDEEKQRKLNAQIETARAAIALGGAIFGETKALMIASAIVETWAGATRAYHDGTGPYNVAISSLIVATGMANVAKIRATKKEGGGKGEAFDDPVNDAMAFSMGRKSVNDFVRLTRDGMVEGFRQALESMGGAPAPIAQVAAGGGDLGGGVTQQISIGNVYGGDAGLRELSRVLERASRLDRPRQFR